MRLHTHEAPALRAGLPLPLPMLAQAEESDETDKTAKNALMDHEILRARQTGK